MLDTIMKLFGALGIVITCIQLFEWLFYRKMKGNGHLLVDLRGINESKCLENLDLLSSSLQKACTRALITKIYILISESSVMRRDDIKKAMKLLDLEAQIIIETLSYSSDTNNNEFSQENPTVKEIHS